MFAVTSKPLATAFALATASVVVLGAAEQGKPENQQLQDELVDLKIQLKRERQRNHALTASYARAAAEAESQREALAQARRTLESLGVDALSGGSEKLVQATSEIQHLNERLLEVEGAAMQLSHTVLDFLKGSVHPDPEARAAVEADLRRVEYALGFRDKVQSATSGDLNEARVVSIDRESGVIVLNVGEQQGTRIGMQFGIFRGDERVAQTIVTDVRDRICGVLVQQLDQQDDGVRHGDIASVTTVNP